MKASRQRKASVESPPMLLRDEQLSIAGVGATNPLEKVTPIPIEIHAGTQRNRGKLEAKYAERLENRLDMRRLVTYVPNKKLPIYNWFKYKEGFSRELVVRLFREFGLQAGDTVFDPFAGSGTTLLAGKELGIHGIGIDMLPTAVFVAKAKLTDWPDMSILLEAASRLTSAPFCPPRTNLPEIRIINLAFSKQTQLELLFFREEIETYDQPIRDFLMLGLLSILESVSNTSKDGQFLRLVQKKLPPTREALRAALAQMIHDLSEMRMFGLWPKTNARSVILHADAREMCLPAKYRGTVSAVITSPPYLNRYDYSRTYALELCLLSVKSHKEMVDVRHSLLRSHVESKEHQGKGVNLPALVEILKEVRSKPLNNERLPIMIQGYFEDMNLVIRNISEYLKPGGRAALVVANAQFNGENVPTDLLLCELAENHGLATESILITRYKGNSSQQMAIYGRRPVRETILFWRKCA